MFSQEKFDKLSGAGLYVLEIRSASLSTPGVNAIANGMWIPNCKRIELMMISMEGTFVGGSSPYATIDIGGMLNFSARGIQPHKAGHSNIWHSDVEGGITWDDSVDEPKFAVFEDGYVIGGLADIVPASAGSVHPGLGAKIILDGFGSPSSIDNLAVRAWLRIYNTYDD